MALNRKKIAVLKFGGEVIAKTSELLVVLRDVYQLKKKGWSFVICHGGNPQANALTEKLQIKKIQIAGRRITDAATLQVMKQTLAGECNIDIVAAASAVGLNPVGISAASGFTVSAKKRTPKIITGCGPEPIDFGFVGDITKVNTGLIKHLLKGGYTPILNTLAIASKTENKNSSRQIYNINADTVASAIAAKLKVDHLFLITGVPGVLRNKNDWRTRIPHLSTKKAKQAIENGTIVDGMIPKIEESLKNLKSGIGSIHILNHEQGSLKSEAERPGSRGTVLTRL